MFRAVDECGVPTVVIPGRSRCTPALNLAAGLVARRKGLPVHRNPCCFNCSYKSCTSSIPGNILHFPSRWMARRNTTISPCVRKAVTGLRRKSEAIQRGFRVTTNTTSMLQPVCARLLYRDDGCGAEGMMISPGYSYDKAHQQHFTGRELNQSMFRKILSNRDPRWRFNMSPRPRIPHGEAQPQHLGDAPPMGPLGGRSLATCSRVNSLRSCSHPRNGRITGHESD